MEVVKSSRNGRDLKTTKHEKWKTIQQDQYAIDKVSVADLYVLI